jgi:hypothetical protein
LHLFLTLSESRGLSKKRENEVLEMNTPARERGIIQSKWASAELLKYIFIRILTI